MENEKEEIINNNKFLKIVKIRPFSVAYNLKLKENDIILGLNGEYFSLSYDELRNILDEDKVDKVVTILRDQVVFNVKVSSSLGVTCEDVEADQIHNFKKEDYKEFYEKDSFLMQFEIFKNIHRNGIVLNTNPSILASLAPPLWMIYHRMWMFLAFTIIFSLILFFVSPWLFFISWVLKSWYYGVNQINILRNYYKFIDYRFFASICVANEEEAQKKARELDSKIDFDFSYLDPPVHDEDDAEPIKSNP